MTNLSQYFTEKEATISDFILFCKTAFFIEKDASGLDIKLRIRFIPLLKNGTLVVKKNNKFVVYINLFPLIIDRRCSSSIRFFRLYTTILHEFEHARLVSGLKNTKPENFQRALAMAELIPGLRKKNALYTYEGLFSPNAHKQFQHRYQTSSSEQLSIYQSYKFAYQCFGEYLSEDEKKRIEVIIDEICLQNNYMEICYLSRMAPASKFMHLLRSCLDLCKKGKLSVNEYPVLTCFFEENGEVRNIQDIYNEAVLCSIFDSVAAQALLRLFMYQQPEFAELFENDPFAFSYVEDLANEYILRNISYVKAMQNFVVFEDSKVLSDNAAMIMHNIKLLNKQMSKYGMVQKHGTIFPLYKYMC